MFSVVESSNFLVYDLSPDLLSYTSNTMGVTCGEGTAYHPGTPTGSSPVYSMCHVTQFLLFVFYLFFSKSPDSFWLQSANKKFEGSPEVVNWRTDNTMTNETTTINVRQNRD
jgi:hypothetical protein